MLIFLNTANHQWKRQQCWLGMLTEGTTHKPVLSCAAAATASTHSLGKYQGRQCGEKTERNRISFHIPHICIVGLFFVLPRQPSSSSQDQRPFRYTIAKILLVLVKNLKWRRGYRICPCYFSSQPSFICSEEIQVRYQNQIHAMERKCMSKCHITVPYAPSHVNTGSHPCFWCQMIWKEKNRHLG